VVHQGYSAHKGHYYSFIKEEQVGGGEEVWHKYDDSAVKTVEDMDHAHVALQTQKAYILFYKKVSIYNNRLGG